MLVVKNLKVKLNSADKIILDDVSFELHGGEIMSVSGKNGSGKSTLVQSIMGNPNFEIVSGEITFNGLELNDLTPDARSKLGIFLAFQSPIDIPGVDIVSFLKVIFEIHHKEKISVYKIRQVVREYLEIVELEENFLNRNLNEGFSGGERKKFELLQLLLIKPSLIMLDEVDSGLDKAGVDMAIKVIKDMNVKHKSSILWITHYESLVEKLNPNKTIYF